MQKYFVGNEILYIFVSNKLKNKNMDNKKEFTIESTLPLFPGFYNTMFEADEESSIEDGKSWEDYEWNHKDYYNRVAESCAKGIEEQLSNLGIKVEFQAVVSPKFYNFSNDTINVAFHLDSENFDELHKYLLDNIEDFKGYLKEHYTSYDGFTSFHSNEPLDWFKALESKNQKLLEHKLSGMLDFYLGLEEFTLNDLFEYVSNEGELYVSGTLKNEE